MFPAELQPFPILQEQEGIPALSLLLGPRKETQISGQESLCQLLGEPFLVQKDREN